MKEKLQLWAFTFAYHHYWHFFQLLGFLAYMRLGYMWTSVYPGWLKLGEFVGLTIVLHLANWATQREKLAQLHRLAVAEAQGILDGANRTGEKAQELVEDALRKRDLLRLQVDRLNAEVYKLWAARQGVGGEEVNTDQMIEIMAANPATTMFEQIRGQRIFRTWSQTELMIALANLAIEENEISIEGRYGSLLLITPDQQTFRVEIIIPGDDKVAK